MLNILRKIKQSIFRHKKSKILDSENVDRYEVYLVPRSDTFITKIIEYRG